MIIVILYLLCLSLVKRIALSYEKNIIETLEFDENFIIEGIH